MSALTVRATSGIQVTDRNLTPVLQITTWFATAVSILLVLVHLITKVTRLRRWSQDDSFVLTAALLAIAQSIAASFQNTHAFGKYATDVVSPEQESALKASLTANILFVLSLLFSKLTLVAFMWTVTPWRWVRWVLTPVACIACASALASVFVICFQCPLPAVWNLLGSGCIDQDAFWTYIGVMEVLLYLALTTIPVFLVGKLQMPWRKKARTTSFFMAPLLAIAPSVAFIAAIRGTTTDNLFFDRWPAVVCQQVMVATSLVLVCLVQINKALEMFESGMLRTDDIERKQGTVIGGVYGRSSVSRARLTDVSATHHDDSGDSSLRSPGRRIDLQSMELSTTPAPDAATETETT